MYKMSKYLQKRRNVRWKKYECIKCQNICRNVGMQVENKGRKLYV